MPNEALPDPPAPRESVPGLFTTTRWSMVLRAGDLESDDSQRALEYLCTTYWYPLYAYVRRSGRSVEEAQDLTQGFFARMLEKNHFARAAADRGRFRSFLLASLKRFVTDEWRKEQAIKRGGGAVHFSLDLDEAEDRYRAEPADEQAVSPEVLFDRQWAGVVLERVMARLKAEHSRAGKLDRFEALKPYLLDDPEPGAYRPIASALELTESGVRTLVVRMRDRFGFLFKEEIAQTVNEPAHLESEVRHLVAALS